LNENYEHLLADSFDVSFIGAGDNSSSSQNDGFDFSFHGEDPILMPSDDPEIGQLADELARELGWAECFEGHR
jgi:hypothetical protein